MDQDPAVREGIFVYEAHPCRSFPGDCLPGEIGDHKGGKGREDLSRHHGLLKGDPILDRMEADAKRTGHEVPEGRLLELHQNVYVA